MARSVSGNNKSSYGVEDNTKVFPLACVIYGCSKVLFLLCMSLFLGVGPDMLFIANCSYVNKSQF